MVETDIRGGFCIVPTRHYSCRKKGYVLSHPPTGGCLKISLPKQRSRYCADHSSFAPADSALLGGAYPIHHTQRHTHNPGIGLKLFSQRLDVHIFRNVIKGHLHPIVCPG